MIVCIDDVLDLTELRLARKILGSAAYVDGKTTAGYRAKRVKKNLQMDKAAEGAAQVKALVLKGLQRNPTFRRVAIPRTIQSPIISRYQVGMNYGRHVDDALMGDNVKTRTDLSVTLFLSELEDYDGGELVIDTSLGEQEVKLPPGAAVVYPSTALHRVAPVTKGERLAAVTWIQSYVRDAAKREILHDMDLICHALAKLAPEAKDTDLAAKTYSNLLRMWSET